MNLAGAEAGAEAAEADEPAPAGARLRAWALFLAGVLFIAATLELAFVLSGFLRVRGYLGSTIQLLFGVASVAFVYLLVVGAGVRGVLPWVRTLPALALFVVAMLELRSSPAERFHFLEYGLLFTLALRAVVLDVRSPLAYALAAVVTALAGALDEGLQHLSPVRHFDEMDLVVNAVAAAIAALVVLSLLGRRPERIRLGRLPPPADGA